MATVIAYILVVPLARVVLYVGFFVVGFIVALLLAWAPMGLRTRVAGVIGGVAGVAITVAFGYGVFWFVVGPDSFTVGAFLASTLPLLLSVRNDFLYSVRAITAREQLKKDEDKDFVEAVKDDASAFAHASVGTVCGELLGLAEATHWFLSR